MNLYWMSNNKLPKHKLISHSLLEEIYFGWEAYEIKRGGREENTK